MKPQAIRSLQQHWSEPDQGESYFEVVRSIIDRLDCEGKTVLDVGCARGFSTCAYAASGAGRAIGLEVNKTRLDKHHTFLDDLPELQSHVRFLQGTSDTLPLNDESIDGVVMNEALSHYQYPERSLREAYRVLKPNGVLYVFDDNNALDVRGYFRRRFQRWPPYREQYDSQRRSFFEQQYPDLSEDELNQLVQEARGLTFDEIDEGVQENDGTPSVPEPPHNAPRHPEHGAYAEREINPLTLMETLRSIGYEPELVPTHFSVTGTFSRFANTFFHWTHPVSLLLAPGFTIVASMEGR